MKICLGTILLYIYIQVQTKATPYVTLLENALEFWKTVGCVCSCLIKISLSLARTATGAKVGRGFIWLVRYLQRNNLILKMPYSINFFFSVGHLIVYKVSLSFVGELKHQITEDSNNISPAGFKAVRKEFLKLLHYCQEMENS